MFIFTALPKAVEVRLVNDTGTYTSDGHVEVFVNNIWTRICYNSSWTQQTATVVCRQLGLPNEGAVLFPYYVIHAWDNKAIILDAIQCTGNEESLEQCLPVGLDIRTASYCKATYDEVGIVCTNGKKLFFSVTNPKILSFNI